MEAVAARNPRSAVAAPDDRGPGTGHVARARSALLQVGLLITIGVTPGVPAWGQDGSSKGPSKAPAASTANAKKPAGASTKARKHPQKPAARATAPGALQGTPMSTREDAMRLADDIAERRSLDREWVRRTVGEARLLPQVVRLMQPAPAGTPKNWRIYRSRFIDPVRIAAGVRFWNQHRDSLERAEREYGVPSEMVVGIIGVETLYGQHMGSFRVIDALATLSVEFPASHPRAAERSAFFRSELEHFLALHQRTGDDPLRARGSYAGAMGMPQFMPSSRVRFAVDFDGDGRIDLDRSAADVIGSVANYFRAFGWKPGMPTHYAVAFDAARLDKDTLLLPDILPSFSVARFAELGALVDGEARTHEGPLALVELQNGNEPPQYVAGTENFYVITRYNWSSYYAMAVIELGREVKAALR